MAVPVSLLRNLVNCRQCGTVCNNAMFISHCEISKWFSGGFHFHAKYRKIRLANLASVASFFALCCTSQRCCASEGNSLFFVDVNDKNAEWIEIAPSEVVRLVDEVVAKQSKYSSARARLLVYLANDFTYERGDLIQLFRAIEKTDSPAELRERTDPIRRRRPTDVIQKLNWSVITITEDGDDVIEKNERWSSATQSSTYLSTDKIKVIYEGTIRQADVALPGIQNRALVNRLAHFHVPLKSIKEQSIVSAAETPGHIKLVRGTAGVPGRTTVISRDMGSVIHDYTTSPDGVLVEDTWQGPTRVWPGGVSYPTSQLHFRYSGGKVTYVRAVITKQAEFNVPVGATEFVVAVPAGTTVVDVRSGEPTVARLGQPVDDLVKALVDGLPTKSTSRANDLGNANPPASPGRNWFLIVVNVVAIVLLLIIVLAMRRRKLSSV